MKTKKNFNNAVGPQVRQKKPSGKLFPALAVGSVFAGLATATQYFAYDFGYQPALGMNWSHIYAPWDIIRWASIWYQDHPQSFTMAGSMGVVGTAAGMLATAGAKTGRQNSSTAHEYMHGSARWAEEKDIAQAGLLGNEAGVYVGAWVDKAGKVHYLRHDGPEHVLTYAPTRSGKGVGLVVPTLLSWPHSAYITDLKGELWEMTAGWRQKHAKNKVLRFEPAAANGSVCFNPVDAVRAGTEKEVADAQDLAGLIVDPDGQGMKSHWDKTSYALITGMILHVIYKSKNEGTPATLPYIDDLLADPQRGVEELWMEMTQYGHINGENHPVVGKAARDMMDRPEEEAGSVLSTAKSHLALFRDPVVARNISRSDFTIKDLMNDESPVSLYVVTQPADKERMRPLVRILTNAMVRQLADKMEFERIKKSMPLWRRLLSMVGIKQYATSFVRTKITYKHRLLGMMDEFPTLGKLPVLQEALAFLAGYGIKFYLICQDLNQLKSRDIGYGPDESISSNCHVQNAYPPNRVETAEHLSKLCGVTTVVKEQITESGRRFAALLGQVSRTQQEVQRPLLTPDECMRMPGPKKQGALITEPGDMIVSVAGFPAIYGQQPLFFKDPIFEARAGVPPPEKSDVLRTHQKRLSVTL